MFRTCRELGIETVAVHSDADAALPFVREADLAVRLPGNAPAETYLRGDLVIEAAQRAGADAIHPGYGFLSENADFARAVVDAGLTWVGPAPESIEQMGSKVEAKKLMEAAGVPVLGEPVASSTRHRGRPAAAGQGVRRRRRPRHADRPRRSPTCPARSRRRRPRRSRRSATAPSSSSRTSSTAGTSRSRSSATPTDVLVLGERDCSIQRRHQKVVEETPAPRLPRRRPAPRCTRRPAAAAEAIDYRGAGTVEFLYDAETDRFFFLEMNTRLQVEHPVTELVHGVDLVELQLAVAEASASRRSSTASTDDPDGHAIEVRLYAEDPAAD